MTKTSTTPSAPTKSVGAATPPNQGGELSEITCRSPNDTFEFGERLGGYLRAGDVVLLYGGLGAGKTLLTKGILHALGFDIDEVTSPSFTLVNLYKTTKLDVYHIDLWRLETAKNAAGAVGLDEILEAPNAITIVEWADRLGTFSFPNKTISISIENDGDQPRNICIKYGKEEAAVE